MINIYVSSDVSLTSDSYLRLIEEIKACTGEKDISEPVLFDPLHISDQQITNIQQSDSFAMDSENIIIINDSHNIIDTDPLSTQELRSQTPRIKQRADSFFNGVNYLIELLEIKDLNTLLAKQKENFLCLLHEQIISKKEIKRSADLLAESMVEIAIVLVPILRKQAPRFFDGLNDIFKVLQLIDRAEEFYIASQPRPGHCTITSAGHWLHAQLDIPCNAFGIDSPAYKILQTIQDPSQQKPVWYSKQPFFYQILILDFAERVIKNPNQIYTLSSRTDLIPGLRNFLKHYSIFSQGQTIQSSSTLRSSHIGGRPSRLEVNDSEDMLAFAKVNFQTIVWFLKQQYPDESKTLLFQTLLTPVPGTPDYKLCQVKTRVLEYARILNSSLSVIPVNHGVNAARGATALFENNLDLSLIPEQLLKTEFYLAALKELANLQNSHYSMLKTCFSDLTRQVHLSAVEELLARHNSQMESYSTCISGKDRRALVLLYAAALEEFFVTYNAFYIFNDTEENISRFYQILAKLFYSSHAQRVASDNAPGAAGLKELQNNASKHLEALLPDDLFAVENALGNLNTLVKMVEKSEKCMNIIRACNHPHTFEQTRVAVMGRVLNDELSLRKAFFSFLQTNASLFKKLPGSNSFQTTKGLDLKFSNYLNMLVRQFITVLEANITNHSEKTLTAIENLAIMMLELPAVLTDEEKLLLSYIFEVFENHITSKLCHEKQNVMAVKTALNHLLLLSRDDLSTRAGCTYQCFDKTCMQMVSLVVSKDLLILLNSFDTCLKNILQSPEKSANLLDAQKTFLNNYKPRTLSVSGFFKKENASNAEKSIMTHMQDLLDTLGVQKNYVYN